MGAIGENHSLAAKGSVISLESGRPKEAGGSLAVLGTPFQSLHLTHQEWGWTKGPFKVQGGLEGGEFDRSGQDGSVSCVFIPIHPLRTTQMIFMALSTIFRAIATQLSSFLLSFYP